MNRWVVVVLALCWSVSAGAAEKASSPAAQPAAAGSVRVMSFNIRNSNAKDGENGWEKRKEFLIATISAYDPDLLGTQEVLPIQADYLQEKLPGYGFAGAGRDDGKRGGEFSPVMFKKKRFEQLASGQYWLSETPEKVGSKGWDAALPRIMTWVKLKDLTTGRPLMYFNTHWDHKGVKARVESGKLMRRLIEQKRDGLPVIVTGDFNSAETSEQYRSLTAGDGNGVRLIDAYRTVHPEVSPEEATFNGFKGTRTGRRIDWILHSPEWVARGAAIDYAQKDGRYPSDHYPVTAEIEPQK
jgi:endonuclease/exonuclease/phosphatase family metal-dependent hydrolase